jgi:hypothetical protein
VKLGREAAAETRKQYPVIENQRSRAICRSWAIGWWWPGAVFKHGRVWRDEGQFA